MQEAAGHRGATVVRIGRLACTLPRHRWRGAALRRSSRPAAAPAPARPSAQRSTALPGRGARATPGPRRRSPAHALERPGVGAAGAAGARGAGRLLEEGEGLERASARRSRAGSWENTEANICSTVGGARTEQVYVRGKRRYAGKTAAPRLQVILHGLRIELARREAHRPARTFGRPTSPRRATTARPAPVQLELVRARLERGDDERHVRVEVGAELRRRRRARHRG